ncbi:polysaccharide pyruvyl transferase family protein [Paraburkholderia aspalathi]|uniref:polysaccharide pyruvyl transferase family protein n=1 Tax=Paraburkholderia aspalathi TaxID=1324617 RepID=UPI0038BB9676
MNTHPLISSHSEAMAYLKNKINVIADIIGPEPSIAYLDYPVHLNTGDLLIMKGTEAFFSHHMLHPVVRRSVVAQSRTDGTVKGIIEGKTTIVLQGGGNLGDLYPLHENLRELLIARYPQNKIVILPQTLCFSSRENLDRAAKRYRSHPDLHICCRDEVSLELARKYLSPNVYLLPDMAHFLWPIIGDNQVERRDERLFLIRTDTEAAAIPEDYRDCIDEFQDWDDLRRGTDVFVEFICKKMGALDRIRQTEFFPVTTVWYKFVDGFIARNAAAFQGRSEVITSRLHGHIFATLLGIDNTLIDNSYGKNSSYYKAWTHLSDKARLC